MNKAKIALATIVLLFAQSIGAADQPGPQTITDANDPFVRLLEARNQDYQLAAQNGDVSAYEAIRPREIVESMRSHLTVIDKMNEYSSMLKRSARNQVALEKYTFYRGDRSSDSARLIYARLNPETQITEYAVIMFRLEDDTWKVGATGSIQTAGLSKTERAGVSKPLDLGDLLEQEQFRLPQ